MPLGEGEIPVREITGLLAAGCYGGYISGRVGKSTGRDRRAQIALRQHLKMREEWVDDLAREGGIWIRDLAANGLRLERSLDFGQLAHDVDSIRIGEWHAQPPKLGMRRSRTQTDSGNGSRKPKIRHPR